MRSVTIAVRRDYVLVSTQHQQDSRTSCENENPGVRNNGRRRDAFDGHLLTSSWHDRAGLLQEIPILLFIVGLDVQYACAVSVSFYPAGTRTLLTVVGNRARLLGNRILAGRFGCRRRARYCSRRRARIGAGCCTWPRSGFSAWSRAGRRAGSCAWQRCIINAAVTWRESRHRFSFNKGTRCVIHARNSRTVWRAWKQ